MIPIKDGQMRKTGLFESGFDESDVMAVIERLNNHIEELEEALKCGESVTNISDDYLENLVMKDAGLFRTGYNKSDVLMVIGGLISKIKELEDRMKSE